MILTQVQLEDWLRTAKCIDSDESYEDENGNKEGKRIFEKGEKLWSLDYCNDKPGSRWNPDIGKYGSFVKGEYELIEVVSREKLTVETIYVPVDDKGNSIKEQVDLIETFTSKVPTSFIKDLLGAALFEIDKLNNKGNSDEYERGLYDVSKKIKEAL